LVIGFGTRAMRFRTLSGDRAAFSNLLSINGGEKAASLLQAVDLVAASAGHKNPLCVGRFRA
jgi:hypothetical protein